MNYEKLLHKLYQVNLFGGVKLGLSNSQALDRALNHPSKGTRFIHVAGTNGKGSVCTKIAKGLECAGFRTGLYTSPHISSFRERIRINGTMISETAVETGLQLLFELAEKQQLTPTFFEYATLLALNYFQEEQLDFAVLETGLGGRLDATNIIQPEVSIITSISLEHTEILGNSIEAITREKGGIIKQGVPVIIGPRVPYQIIKEIANPLEAPLIHVQGVYETFEQENNAIANTALCYLKITEEAIKEGLKALPPCRMEILNRENNKTLIFDVAHNPDGFLHLFKAIQKKYPHNKPCILFGLSKTKDITHCLSLLKENGSAFYPVEAANGRGLPVPELKTQMLNIKIPSSKIFCFPSIQESMQHALDHYDLLLICGTFFIMGETRKNSGIVEPSDAFDMNEKSSLP